MLFEVISSAVVGGLVGYSYLSTSGLTDDGKKIARICTNAGLSAKGETLHLLRRSRRHWGVEYAFRLPLGLSFADVSTRLDAIQDGLNTRGALGISELLQALKRKDFAAVRRLLAGKTPAKKEVELAHDGVLLVRVYEQPLTPLFPYDKELITSMRGWEIPVGTTRTETVRHDFDRHAHMIVAGTTDYGKSVFLKNVITTLTARCPRHVNFFLIDLKGGLAFNRFNALEQVRMIAKNPGEAYVALTAAQSKMNEVIDDLLARGYEDVKEAGIEARYFIVIDEAADISDDKECQAIIKDIARRGRGAGFRLIYATQYPTNETVSSQVRQNCSARLCFRLNTAIASRAVLDEDGAESLPLIKGRAIYQTDRKMIVQTPYVENKFIESTLSLNVTIRSRKDDDNHVHRSKPTAKTHREHTLVIEEIGLS